MRKYGRYPEFNGIEKYVWEALSQPGRTIPTITRGEHGDGTENMTIWHAKPEVDSYVASRLGLKLDDYGLDKSRNPLYKEIANEIRRLRLANVLVDWKKRNTGSGVGIWRLAGSVMDEYRELEDYVLNHARAEILRKDFSASGSLRTAYARAKQSAFREILQRQYRRCVLCGFELPPYMIGAHIVPYNIMRLKEPENAMNPSDGLLLCRLCDTAFERGDITVEADLGIEVSDSLEAESPKAGRWLASILPEIRMPRQAEYPPDPKYLQWKKDILKRQRSGQPGY